MFLKDYIQEYHRQVKQCKFKIVTFLDINNNIFIIQYKSFMYCNNILIIFVYQTDIVEDSPELGYLRPTLKIFLFPLNRPCLTGMGRSVGILFF